MKYLKASNEFKYLKKNVKKDQPTNQPTVATAIPPNKEMAEIDDIAFIKENLYSNSFS